MIGIVRTLNRPSVFVTSMNTKKERGADPEVPIIHFCPLLSYSHTDR